MAPSKKTRERIQGHCASLRLFALRRLRDNVLTQNYMPAEGSPAKAPVDGHLVPLSAYIPYVGARYFHTRPRILCYAINQNLSKHRRWTDDWTQRWARDIETSIDRLNRACTIGKALPIKPYAEGFIPLVAAMAYMEKHSPNHNQDRVIIDDVIAVTNFVKFSTADDASSSSIPSSWWRECGTRYVREEITVLQPDIVIAFGQRTYRELQRATKMIPNDDVGELRLCRFPGRIPSIKARPLSVCEERMWLDHILPLAGKLRKPPDGSYHSWRMLRFPGYFLDIAKSWRMTFCR